MLILLCFSAAEIQMAVVRTKRCLSRVQCLDTDPRDQIPAAQAALQRSSIRRTDTEKLYVVLAFVVICRSHKKSARNIFLLPPLDMQTLKAWMMTSACSCTSSNHHGVHRKQDATPVFGYHRHHLPAY